MASLSHNRGLRIFSLLRFSAKRSVRASTELRDEQRQIVQFAVVPDLDMAGARGSALAALQMLRIAVA